MSLSSSSLQGCSGLELGVSSNGGFGLGPMSSALQPLSDLMGGVRGSGCDDDLRALLLDIAPRSLILVEDFDRYLRGGGGGDGETAAARTARVLGFMDGISSIACSPTRSRGRRCRAPSVCVQQERQAAGARRRRLRRRRKEVGAAERGGGGGVVAGEPQ
ncbi:unnamed protein product [Urochloa humidicola]